MKVYPVSGTELKKIELFFEGWNEALLWSCLQGYMGSAWANDSLAPTAAQIVTADFCFFAGEVSEALLKNRPAGYPSDFTILVPKDDSWARAIERLYGNGAKRAMRYAIKKEKDIFDAERLQSMTEALSGNFELRMIDEPLYRLAMEQEWSKDLCSQFATYEEYRKNGLGAAALHNGALVSGASSYAFYRDGIEIEVDTRKDYRRKGLASACAAKLILECLKRGLYPSWDAQNKCSVALAEKLGYHFDHEYPVYELCEFGKN